MSDQTVQVAERRGWFADFDDEQDGDYRWQPCLETGHGHVPCFQAWFRTRAECEQWIADQVIDVGWLPGEPTTQPAVAAFPEAVTG